MVREVYIDPPSRAFYENRFFTDSELNRDECLRPYIHLKDTLGKQGVEVNTFDLWDKNSGPIEYYSFGMLDHLDALAVNSDVSMKSFYIFEPPVVDPSIYQALPKLTSMFEQVYVHNIQGDGYSLNGVDQTRLRKLYWPQPFNHVVEPFWSNVERERRVVVINGNHKPVSRDGELYSKRIEAMIHLSEHGCVDLYGHGWERWWSRSSMWMPYWKNRQGLLSIYKGPCRSKFEVLSRYDFCLCFENMAMDGYMTEKMFDCLYAGCVPIYCGAANVADYVDCGAYIDVAKFHTWDELVSYIQDVPQSEIEVMKQRGKRFLESKGMYPFYNSLILTALGTSD
ncbi:glycosyltransferase family 10 domain-containing protein [Mariprofundus ferrooxydans]|uniref:glycosyltransferase family 10 domain-containing protein n=1 Tax=Mariprofundus ferrooxydans TaxID=314344 RepID=UPI00035C42FC|nr:glycosyltransferase family 10 [Mariprofundus ferrooxydans]